MTTRRLLLGALAAAGLSSSLSGCFTLAATGMVVGALSISDRRTTGAQADDQAIEIKAFNRYRDRFKGDAAVTPSVTSYNRIALVTGFVPDEQTKAEVGRIASQIENVRQVINEVFVGVPASLATYGKDVVLTTRVKTAMLDAKDLNGNLIKVVSESGTVYLMGMVVPREADRASEIAARVPGVRRVIRAFEMITEAQAKALESAAKDGKSLPDVRGQATGAPPSATPALPATPATPSGVQVTPVR
jgi:osmotically-inducible protein OsmY